MTKRIISALLSAIVCISMLPLQIFVVAEDTYCPFSGGSGTKDDPYQIATAYDLRLLSELVNDADTNSEYKSCYYIQTADIDLNDEPFTPIAAQVDADTKYNFTGYYNGNYKDVYGLYVESSYTYVGLFGRLTGGAVENLSVEGTITSPKVGHCGGLVGEIANTAAVRNCSFNGEVTGAYAVGGIAGYIWIGGVVESCYFNGSLTSTGTSSGSCGGIVGAICNGNKNDTTVSGSVTIQNCYATGEISAAGEGNNGGIVGTIGVYGENSTQSISNNYYLYTMADTGINGDVTTGCSKLSADLLKSAAELLGSPFVDNCETDGFNDGYPIFEWQSTPYQFKGSGTAEDPYQISSKDELKKMRDLINSAYFTSQYNTCYYIQTADIDLENELWKPIGIGRVDGVYDTNPMFKGVYDGQRHNIYNFTTDSSQEAQGLFGYIRNSKAVVKNIVVYGEVSADGGKNAGGITSELQYGATIENCAFIGDVKNTSETTGYVGGIVGKFHQGGTVLNCYHLGDVYGGRFAGGVVGATGVGENESSKDAVIKNCYQANGTVTCGTEDVGAICGNVYYGNIVENTIHFKNCYYSKNTASTGCSNESESNDYTMLTDNLMKQIAPDLGLPYVTNPNKTFNAGYPIFAWQLDTWGKGDINLDGEVSVADAVYLQGYLLGRFSFNEIEWDAANLIDDENVSAFDLCLLKRLLIEVEEGST